MKQYSAEFLGTFWLVLGGCGSAVLAAAFPNVGIGLHGVALAFGLTVVTMAYAVGHISGGHFNPAVTIAFSVAKLFKWAEVIPYIVAQLTGAFLASLLMKILFPSNTTLGATLPAGSELQSFILEAVLTFFLMLVILFTSQGSKEVGVMAGIAIGATVLLEAMFAGPICGASMNPARSIAPAIVSGVFTSFWIYIAAPIVGALLATLVWVKLKPARITR